MQDSLGPARCREDKSQSAHQGNVAAHPTTSAITSPLPRLSRRLVKEFVDGRLGEDRSIFLGREEGDGKTGDFMEVRFTMVAGSDDELEQLITELRANPEIDPKKLIS